MKRKHLLTALLSLSLLAPLSASAEILAMLNYESKPSNPVRQEGIAIIDVDPESKNFGKILNDIPLPNDLVAHHIFYNKDASKAYITALGNGSLYVMDMKHVPYTPKKVDVPDCQVGEDVIFSKDGKTWYLTCMGSSNVIVGDAATDKQIKVIASTDKNAFIRYPHGIGLNDDIDRMIVTSTVRPSDLGDAGDTVAVIQPSTGKVLSNHRLSEKAEYAGESPVEAVFLPHAEPALAYINTMFGGKLWTAKWNEASKDFSFEPVFDFKTVDQGVPLEIYFNDEHDRLFVSTALSGALNIFDISGDLKYHPKHLKTIATAGGAHHTVFSPNGRYAIVQNSFLNLPNMDDGSISVIDLLTNEKIADINALKDKGFNPNCIIMLPKWHHDDAH